MITILGMSVIFILGHDLLTQCHYFNAESITVSGLNRLSPKMVLDQGGINQRTNVLAVNLALTRKRLLAHPWIDDAEVNRKLPNRININIIEHNPIAILDLGRKFILDTNGKIFKEKSASDPNDLPIISGLEFSDLSVTENFRTLPFQAVMTILQLGQKNEGLLPNRLIRRIHVDREIGLTVYAFDKPKAIKLGYDDYPDKLESLKNIIYHLEERHEPVEFESIDLHNLNRIVVNPVKIKSSDKIHKEV